MEAAPNPKKAVRLRSRGSQEVQGRGFAAVFFLGERGEAGRPFLSRQRMHVL